MPERLAYICVHKDCKPPRRTFLFKGDPVPRCPEHGKMIRQVNVVHATRNGRAAT